MTKKNTATVSELAKAGLLSVDGADVVSGDMVRAKACWSTLGRFRGWVGPVAVVEWER